MTIAIYDKTCQVCEATKQAFLKFVMGVWSIGESAGRARFIKAMEYRSYCMAIRELRSRGYYQKANEISEFKHKIYKTS